MQQYLDILTRILRDGVWKESGRPNMPKTLGLSNATITMDLSKGFPLITTKKMFFKGIVGELLWILRGDTNIKYLVDNGINIWNQDAYKWYKRVLGSDAVLSFDEFIEVIRRDYATIYSTPNYKPGDLGKVYGYQWRNQNGVDQIAELIDGLQTNPYSRYHIVDSWNKADFNDMALPPCHLLYQFIVRPLPEKERLQYVPNEVCVNGNIEHIFDVYHPPKFYLDLNVYQRSCDMFLGVPFNLASMSLFLHIIANAVNMIPGIANWIGGDVHIYENHIDAVREQLKRTPHPLPTISLQKSVSSLGEICNLQIEDILLINYHCESRIKGDLSVGI